MLIGGRHVHNSTHPHHNRPVRDRKRAAGLEEGVRAAHDPAEGLHFGKASPLPGGARAHLLFAGAVAYYTLLSLIPLLILILMVLSNIFAEDRILLMLREYLEFVVPGQSNALVEELRNFLSHRELVGGFLLVTLLFFSALAFTVLENAMSVIFFHRVKIRRRYFLVSVAMPY